MSMTLGASEKGEELFMSSSSVIVLNKQYEFWTEVGIRKVLKWMLQDKIEVVVEKEDETIGTMEFRVKMPLVVRLLKFTGYKIKSEHVSYSDRLVFNRDNNICQYYHHNEDGSKFKYVCTEDERTIDHVVPKDAGGKTSFVNCVCCCRHCNEVLKKNRTPKEAGLELLRKPFVPKRRRGEYASFRFVFNPKKLSHIYYMEKFLQRNFSHLAELG